MITDTGFGPTVFPDPQMSKYNSFDSIEEILTDSIYFDGDWYVRFNKIKLSSDESPLEHYKNNGWCMLLRPSFYFDPKWYVEKYSDVRAAGANPLSHFLLKGDHEGRSACANFEAGKLSFSAQQIEKIIFESKLLDKSWYLSKYSDVAQAKLSPLAHFIRNGLKENRLPNALFDPPWYASQNADIAKYHWNPLLHYILTGSVKGSTPNPFFDPEWYEANYNSKKTGLTMLADFLLGGPGRERNPNAYFDINWYLEKCPEAAEYPGGPICHYRDVGVLERRDPSPAFSTKAYVDANMDVKASRANPLVHFLRSGQLEGRSPKPILRSNEINLFRVGVPEYGPIERVFKFDEQRIGNPRIAVHLHLFYTDLADELARHLGHIPCDFDLFISVPKADVDLDALQLQFRAHLPHADLIELWPCENRGRDLAPLFVDLAAIIPRYDLFCHLHSKKSGHNLAHVDWRRFLSHHILGSKPVVASILEAFELEPNLGLLQPPYHGALRSQPNWGKNRATVDSALARVGISFSGDECPHYPAGSFFWARPRALQPLFDAKLTRKDFPEEGGQVDGTFAHALERLLGIVPLKMGYRVGCYSIDVAHNLTQYHHPKRPYPDFSKDRSADIMAYRAERRATKTTARSKHKKIAFCTAIFGEFDKLLLPETLDPDLDYFCITDQELDGYGVFTIIKSDYLDPDPRRSARYAKTHLWKYVAEYDTVIWVDANILVHNSLKPYLERFGQSGNALAALPHPFRETLFEEAAMCREMALDEADVIADQIARYIKIPALAKETLIETNLLIFDPRRPEMLEAFRIWWNEINLFSRRDQISVNFALHKAGVTWTPLLSERLSLRDCDDFRFFEHGINRWPGNRDIYGGWHKASFNPPARLKPAASIRKHPSVDVVICVHNALDDLKPCLSSLTATAKQPLRLILVDDASNAETRHYLEKFSSRNIDVQLIRNGARAGYTKAANIGIAKSTADVIIMLNSDTIVPRDAVWKLAAGCVSNPRLGIIGPLSNAASFQSVPAIKGTVTQTAINPLPNGMTVDEVDSFFENIWDGVVPITPLVHGFCLCFRRDVLKKVGSFDEDAFPFGYGEENDFCFRAADAGFDLGIMTNTYVFHAKSKSYSDSERVKYMDNGAQALFRKHSKRRVKNAVSFMEKNSYLEKLRLKSRELYDRDDRKSSGTENRVLVKL